MQLMFDKLVGGPRSYKAHIKWARIDGCMKLEFRGLMEGACWISTLAVWRQVSSQGDQIFLLHRHNDHFFQYLKIN